MAYVPDMDKFLSLINEVFNTLDVSELNITSLSKLPYSLKSLDCTDTQLIVLPKLPTSLTTL